MNIDLHTVPLKRTDSPGQHGIFVANVIKLTREIHDMGNITWVLPPEASQLHYNLRLAIARALGKHEPLLNDEEIWAVLSGEIERRESSAS